MSGQTYYRPEQDVRGLPPVVCTGCGAHVAPDPGATAVHDAWHERLESTEAVTLTTSEVTTLVGELPEIGPDRIHIAAATLVEAMRGGNAGRTGEAFLALERILAEELHPARSYGDGLSTAEGSATDGHES